MIQRGEKLFSLKFYLLHHHPEQWRFYLTVIFHHKNSGNSEWEWPHRLRGQRSTESLLKWKYLDHFAIQPPSLITIFRPIVVSLCTSNPTRPQQSWPELLTGQRSEYLWFTEINTTLGPSGKAENVRLTPNVRNKKSISVIQDTRRMALMHTWIQPQRLATVSETLVVESRHWAAAWEMTLPNSRFGNPKVTFFYLINDSSFVLGDPNLEYKPARSIAIRPKVLNGTCVSAGTE